MTIGDRIRTWREYRRWPVAELAARSHLAIEFVSAIEEGLSDPPATTIEALAGGLGVPIPWLYGDPRALMALAEDPDRDHDPADVDPVTAQILSAKRDAQALFGLLAQLIQSAEPKLVRAAEVNLKSLVRQIPRATVPWASRPPGHFEPPAD